MIMKTPIIRIVDDDASFRVAVSRLLKAAGYDVRSFASAAEFLAAEAKATPGCLLLDLHMPMTGGLDLQRTIASAAEPLPIVFVSGNGDIPASVRAMKAGAIDFLTKPVDGIALRSAVDRALAEDQRGRLERRKCREIRARVSELTPRQLEVFGHVATGKINKQIAFDLGTTERTIKAHRSQIMEKLGAASMADLVRIADRLGIGLESEDG